MYEGEHWLRVQGSRLVNSAPLYLNQSAPPRSRKLTSAGEEKLLDVNKDLKITNYYNSDNNVICVLYAKSLSVG